MTRRAAIYARFSTDLQSDRSIDDQVALCRAMAAREGLDVVKVYADRARSGGSLLGRDGLIDLMADARTKAFDLVVVEALDRLSRDMEDLAGLHKRLTFLGIAIRAVHEGEASTVTIGLRGLVGQLYREDNAQKIRRGQAGRVRQGLAGGGLTYGYAPVPGALGRRQIVAEEADVVRRIFADYVAGRTPRDIAHALNTEGARPPRGTRWNASAITGQPKRGSGILSNRLYVGEMVWNKVRMVRDPDTGRRVSRPNPPSEWQVASVPELAIVPADIFAAAEARRAARAIPHPSHVRRPKHLLSGLLRCGACGAGLSTMGRDKSGRVRIRCTASAESGTCPSPQSFYLDIVERAVVSGIERELLQPSLVAAWVDEYQAERRRLAADSNRARTRLERRLEAIDAEATRCVDHLVKGIGDAARIGARSRELAAEEAAVRAELSALPAAVEPVTAHPAVIARYRGLLDDLQAGIAGGLVEGDAAGAEALRELVDTVTVRREGSRVFVTIAGRLNALLGDKAFPNGIRSSGGKMVAEEGFEPPTRGL